MIPNKKFTAGFPSLMATPVPAPTPPSISVGLGNTEVEVTVLLSHSVVVAVTASIRLAVEVSPAVNDSTRDESVDSIAGWLVKDISKTETRKERKETI